MDHPQVRRVGGLRLLRIQLGRPLGHGDGHVSARLAVLEDARGGAQQQTWAERLMCLGSKSLGKVDGKWKKHWKNVGNT